MSICLRALLGLPLVLLLQTAVLSPAFAGATINVTTTADGVEGNGNCTLREAIIAANTDSAVDTCPAGSGADTIALPPGTYVLSRAGPREDAAATGDLDITSELTIAGPGRVVTTLDGGSRREALGDRVLHVLPGGHLAISGVTVRGGYCASGGGILNAGWLAITDSTVKDNVASEIADECWAPIPTGGAGIYNTGELHIVRSTLSDNWMYGTASYSDVASPGGGLLNKGTAVITASVVIRNFAASGGGIRNDLDLRLVETWVANNSARFYGAGLDNMGHADLSRGAVSGNVDGGILNGRPGAPATLRLDTVTVSANRSHRLYGSIHNWGGTVAIQNSTIAGNYSVEAPGGIWGPAQVVNTLIANGPYGDCAGAITSLGYNLDTDGTCGLTRPSDLPLSDPGLGPLTDNGGPTPTHALNAWSVALDRIPEAACLGGLDQRGVSRPYPAHGACDVGAYERSPAGDITLLLDAVRSGARQGLLTRPEEQALVSSLKAAWLAIMNGNPESACVYLDDFAETVAEYVGHQRLDPVVAGAWGRAIKRIKSMVCT
ncbi:MAG: choice-of-anchor Q domain-containing protein [Vicinamibacterales bacterium]